MIPIDKAGTGFSLLAVIYGVFTVILAVAVILENIANLTLFGPKST